MASDSPSLLHHSMRIGIAAHQPSKRHHAQSPLGPSFYDLRTTHILKFHPERAAPVSRRNDERRHAVCSHSALVLCLYLAACNTSSRCPF